MGTIVKTVMTRREYDFTGLALGASALVVVERAIDVVYGERVELLVRVHDAAFVVGSSIKIIARPVTLTQEDPSVDFLVDDGLQTTVTLDDSNDGLAPFLIIKSLPRPFGHQIQLQVKASRLVGLFAGCRATISVSLVFKD